MEDVAYSRQTVDSPNPLARYAHRARISVALDAVADAAPQAARVLDFGCGPGVFLHELASRRPDLHTIGYDPFHQGAMEPGVELVSDLATVADHSIGVFTAFETCEHLDDAELGVFLDEAERMLTIDGIILLSVPIIGGPGILAKEANRMILHRRRSDYSLKELAGAVVGRPAARADVKTSHKGFDFKALRSEVAEKFDLVSEWYSPFRWAPWPVNSQHFTQWRVRPPAGA